MFAGDFLFMRLLCKKIAKVLLAAFSGGALFFFVFHCFFMPETLFDDAESSLLFDKEGNLLCARIASDGQWRFPETDSLDKRFVTCLLNYEDRRFYSHLGIDVYSVLRALKRNVQSETVKEGASTLTMQLARMARGNRPRTMWNKIVEALWAVDIELTHSKEEILKLYVSHAPFGGNTVGAQTASWRYFNRDLSRLSWAEAATLAVLPNSPALIHPGRNRSALKRKRDVLLGVLRKRDVLTAEEYELALLEDLPEKPYLLPNDAPHYFDFLRKNSQTSVMKSSIDMRLQRLAQRLVNDYSARYRLSNHLENMALVVLEVETGQPVVYVGNTTDSRAAASQVDVVQSERSPGSTLKPFLYAAMMSSGEITPRQLISDTPLTINGFTPSNFNKGFSGAVHADDAVIQSLNVPLVRMLSLHTTSRFMEDLKWLGMSTLHYSEDHYGASLVLGGAEVKLWDLCRMYRKLARKLYYDEPDSPSDRLSKPAIWHMFKAMSQLNRPEEEAQWTQFKSMKNIAWKTGTSWGGRDAWSVGVTSKYVVGVWCGNATGEGRAGVTGVGFASPVMFDVFALLDDSDKFYQPSQGMELMAVCRNSGCLASLDCAVVDTLYLPEKSREADICNYCRVVHLSEDGRWQVNLSCAENLGIKTEKRFVLPAAQEFFYKKCHADYRALPPFHPDCESMSGESLDFIYPEHNAEIVIPRGFDGKFEEVVFSAVSKRADATLFWHMDNTYIGSTKDDHKISLTPEKGSHVLSVVDDIGNRRAVMIHLK